MTEQGEIETERNINSRITLNFIIGGAIGGLALAEVANSEFFQLEADARFWLDYCAASTGLGLMPIVGRFFFQ